MFLIKGFFLLRDSNIHFISKTMQPLYEKLTSKINLLSLDLKTNIFEDSSIQNESDLEFINHLDSLFKDLHLKHDDFNVCVICVTRFKGNLNQDMIKKFRNDILDQRKRIILTENDETINNFASMLVTTQSKDYHLRKKGDFETTIYRHFIFRLEIQKNISQISRIILTLKKKHQFDFRECESLKSIIFKRIKEYDNFNDLIELLHSYRILNAKNFKDDFALESNSNILDLYEDLLKNVNSLENYSISLLRNEPFLFHPEIDPKNKLFKIFIKKANSLANIESLYGKIDFNSIKDQSTMNLLMETALKALENEFFFSPNLVACLFMCNERYQYQILNYLDKYLENLSIKSFFKFIDALFKYKNFDRDFINCLLNKVIPIAYRNVFGYKSFLSFYFTNFNDSYKIESLYRSKSRISNLSSITTKSLNTLSYHLKFYTENDLHVANLDDLLKLKNFTDFLFHYSQKLENSIGDSFIYLFKVNILIFNFLLKLYPTQNADVNFLSSYLDILCKILDIITNGNMVEISSEQFEQNHYDIITMLSFIDRFNSMPNNSDQINYFKKLNEKYFLKFSELFSLEELIDYNLTMLNCNFLNLNSIKQMKSVLMSVKEIEVFYF